MMQAEPCPCLEVLTNARGFGENPKCVLPQAPFSLILRLLCTWREM